tara:strand:+ start:1155 stop:2999 length:1845 start_codon:yes stop_codon:yes gene_type:complete
MLKTDAKSLYLEIEHAENLRDAHLAAMSEQVEKFTGPHYANGQSEYVPENHYYEYVSLMVPRLIFDNPRVRVSSRRSGTQQDVAEALRHGLNRWCRDSDFRKLLTLTATDSLFNYGVLLVTEEINQTLTSHERTEARSKPMWPVITRVPQKRFFVDPLATNLHEARFMGHKWVRDKEDLLAEARENPDAGWNSQALEQLAEGTGTDELYDRPDAPDRGEIVAYEIWVPEIEDAETMGPDAGFHGTIYTLATGASQSEDERDTMMIREPRAYYGPRWGPYVFFGMYPVPDSIYPLSPITAVEGQVEDLNRHVSAAAHSAENYKKLVFTDASDPRLQQKLKESDDYVIPVQGLDKQKMVQAEIGGMTPTQMSYIEAARDRLDRNSGIQEAQRGNVEGHGTATEVQIAEQAATIRLAFQKQQFQDAVERALRTVAWYLYYDDRIVFPLGQDAANELGMTDPWLVGGSHEEDSGATFDDLELEIEPYSMERTTEGQQQRRAMEVLELITNISPMIPQAPYINWAELFTMLGDAMNVPKLEQLIDVDFAMELGGMQVVMPSGSGQADPMLAGQVGKAGNQGPLTRPTARARVQRVPPKAIPQPQQAPQPPQNPQPPELI